MHCLHVFQNISEHYFLSCFYCLNWNTTASRVEAVIMLSSLRRAAVHPRTKSSIDSMIVYLSLFEVLPVSKSSWDLDLKVGDVNAGASQVGVDVEHSVVRVFEQQADMQQSMESLVRLLESYRGRDKVVSTRVFTGNNGQQDKVLSTENISASMNFKWSQ